jgi:hypothetical protein
MGIQKGVVVSPSEVLVLRISVVLSPGDYGSVIAPEAVPVRCISSRA